MGLGLHFPGFPEEPDWTKALGVFAKEEPVWFGAILAFIMIAEGESVGHSGDNFRGKSTKREPGDLNFDYLGLKKKLSDQKLDRYREIELKVREELGVPFVHEFCSLQHFLTSLSCTLFSFCRMDVPL